MSVNTQPSQSATQSATLGGFLRDRRARLQPDASAAGRRRTPGLRREEVATRAGVSVTWYTWLEQGRGGPPSDEVLERLARALELDAKGRELLFLLAQQRPPPIRAQETPEVAPAVQRVLDAMPTSPALVRTPTWDIVAWNAAAEAVLGDYPAMAPRERNALRRLFTDPTMREVLPDWTAAVRFAVAMFRVDVARVGGWPEAQALIDDLSSASPEFRELWAETEVLSHGHGVKRFRHPVAGPLQLEISAFSIEGAEGLSLIVYTPVASADVRSIEALLERREKAA
jgi:transcriptional regulator with XRE-family HTH domain